MRNLARLGMVTAGLLALNLPATAAEVTYNINGQMGKLTNVCFNIAVSLTNTDCSYADTRIPSPPWSGPIAGSSFYPIGSAGDNILYIPADGDGKLQMPLSGTVTIDDAGTPGDGTDDLISGTFSFGAAAFNASTGNGDRAVERWDSWTHTMAPTPVDAAVAQPGGGFEYLIGSRGKPTPAPLFIAGNPAETFPSELAHDTTEPGNWDTTVTAPGATPAAQRVGIERSIGFSLAGTISDPPVPNLGATTTAVFENYSCEDNPGDSDCVGLNASQTSSATLFGPNRNGTDPFSAPFADPADTDPNSVPLTAGFSNVILILTTDGAGAITDAQAYWTREYLIKSGPDLGTDQPSAYTTNNSWTGGRFAFTGLAGTSIIPAAFVFPDRDDVPLKAVQVSDAVTIIGLSEAVAVSVIGGEYSINGGAFTGAAGTASNGDQIRVRHFSANTPFTKVDTTLIVGGYGDTFTSTTQAIVAVDDAATTNIDQSVVIEVLANDVGFSDPVIVALWSVPLHGTVDIANSPGPKAGVILSYQPDPGFIGQDQFEYAVDDDNFADIAAVTVRIIDDGDGDGIDAEDDNCTAVANPDQRDSNGDGFGNLCDGDFDNNGFVNYVDLSMFRQQFGTAGPDADLNGNGFVNFTDLAIFRGLFGKPPGPSGVAP